MPKKIIGEGSKQTLASLNKRAQNKMSRLRTVKGLEANIEFDFVTPTEAPEKFKTKKDYNAYKKQVQDFLKRDADFTVENKNGVDFNYSDIREAEKAMRKANRKKQKMWDEIKNLPVKSREDVIGTVEEIANPRFGFADPRYNYLKPLKFDVNKIRNQKELENFIKRAEYYGGEGIQLKQEQFKENYLKAIVNAFNLTRFSEFPELNNQVKEIYDHVRNMDTDEFIKMHLQDFLGTIAYIYSPEEEEKKIDELQTLFGLRAS